MNALSRVEEASLFLRDLRPGNERLIYHRLDVYRDGRRFPALNADNIQVFRREASLQDHVINHRLTVSHSMDDLRVGDVIDIQATIVEQACVHPTAVKHHLSLFWLNWNCHVVQQKIRIINRSRRSLNLHQHLIEEGRECDNHVELKPKQECERHYSDLAPKSISNTAPAWLYTDFLQVSPAITWAQLSREFNQVYNDAARRDADLDCSEIDRIELTGNHRTDALRIIRFVQNDIRYLSECDGIYSHTPKPPRHVLRRGAGDCKGKSNLLVVLLRSIGVEANPALVHSGTGNAIGEYAPAANHFNHVILRVVIDGRHYYFDPTLQPRNRQISNPYFDFCKRSWAQGGVLNFHTRVSPALDVVGHDDIEHYFEDAREMYQDRESRFAQQADTDEVIWREIAGELLKLVAIIVVLWVLI